MYYVVCSVSVHVLVLVSKPWKEYHIVYTSVFVCISVQLLSTAVTNRKYLGKKVDFLMYMYYHRVQQNLMVPLLKFPSTAIV